MEWFINDSTLFQLKISICFEWHGNEHLRVRICNSTTLPLTPSHPPTKFKITSNCCPLLQRPYRPKHSPVVVWLFSSHRGRKSWSNVMAWKLKRKTLHGSPAPPGYNNNGNRAKKKNDWKLPRTNDEMRWDVGQVWNARTIRKNIRKIVLL